MGAYWKWQHDFMLVISDKSIYQDTARHVMKRTSRCYFQRSALYRPQYFMRSPQKTSSVVFEKPVWLWCVMTLCFRQVLPSMSPVTSSSTASAPSLKRLWWEFSLYPSVLTRYLDDRKAAICWKKQQISMRASDFTIWLLDYKYSVNKTLWLFVFTAASAWEQRFQQ